MKDRISVISAGAGSGKTYRVVKELTGRLLPERVAPGEILVTTFTRLAASEVGERVREALLKEGRDDLARRLGEGLLGTVDSVASELVRRFAFDAGLSPQTVVVDEEEGYRAFSEALAVALDTETLELMHHSEEVLGLGRDDDTHGSFNPFQGRSWRKTAMEIAQMARSNGLHGQALLDCAETSIEALEMLLPPAHADGEALDRELRVAIVQVLDSVPCEKDTTKTTAEYRRDLQDLAVRISSRRLPWSDWVRWAARKPGAKSAEAAEPVRDAAGKHLVHPRLREDVARYVRWIFRLAARSIDIFQKWKEDRGLLDFVDLETRALGLLDREDVARRLAERVKLVLVDEFQDTNPLQLALFLKLAGIAEHSVWVGDPKQTIYEFRGADPKLMGEVLSQLGSPAPEDILGQSWRSRRELVELVSELFVPAFAPILPPEQVRLTAVREEDDRLPPPIFHWPIAEAKNLTEVSAAIARGIAGLLGRDGGEPVQVYDKEAKAIRAARPSDIAVLCFTGNRCERISNALEAVGIRTALERRGLMATPEAVLVLGCLRRLVDPGDSLATAEIVSLSALDPEPETWLAERIAYLQTGQAAVDWRRLDPAIAPLEKIREQLSYLSPTEVLDRVLSVMDLHRKVLAWGREEVRLGNLEALRRLAARYEEGCSRVHSGASVAGLVHWLEELESAGRDDQSRGVGPEAVQVLTVHGSKGLEWPIVVLAQLDREFQPNVWTLGAIAAPGQMDLKDPLKGRCLRYWPWPYGSIRSVPALEALLDESAEQESSSREQREEAVRLLYVAMTRARDALAIPSWKGVRSAKDSPGQWLSLVADDGRLPLPPERGDHEVGLRDSDLRLRVRTTPLTASEPVRPLASRVDWFPQSFPLESGLPACLEPSGLKMPPGARVDVGNPIGLGATMPIPPGTEMDKAGSAIHAFLGADVAGLRQDDRLEMAKGLLSRWRVALDPATLLARGEELLAVLTRLHGEGSWLREWPVRLLHDEVLIPGQVDLAIDTDAGWVLVDHKCFPGAREQWADFAAGCAPQLAAYAVALTRASEKPVVAAYVHLAVCGVLMPVALPSALDAFVTRVIEASG